MRALEESTPNGAEIDPITANIQSLEEHRIHVPGLAYPNVVTTSGVVGFRQGGELRATGSFWSYEHENRPFSKYDPVAFVMNGGPLTPASSQNGRIFSGFQYLEHNADGHLGDEPRIVPNKFSSLWLCRKVVHWDPPTVGLANTIPGQDPTWSYGVVRDGTITSAFTKEYLQAFGLTDHPLMFIVSSYSAFRAVATALDLVKQGVPVASITVINGTYDLGLAREYDETNPQTFSSLLPSLAAAHGYYKGHGRDYAASLQFQSAVAYQDAYNDALAQGRTTNRDVRTLQELTGLPAELIAANGLRLSRKLFMENRKSGRVISAIDSRLDFPAGEEYEFDPAIDRWNKTYIDSVTKDPTAYGYPKIYRDNYRGIIVARPWPFEGIWANHQVHEGMEELIRLSPHTTFLDISGYYDLNRPALHSQFLWDAMRERTNIEIADIVQTPGDASYREFYPEARVERIMLHMGHQLTRPARDPARILLNEAINRQIMAAEVYDRRRLGEYALRKIDT